MVLMTGVPYEEAQLSQRVLKQPPYKIRIEPRMPYCAERLPYQIRIKSYHGMYDSKRRRDGGESVEVTPQSSTVIAAVYTHPNQSTEKPVEVTFSGRRL